MSTILLNTNLRSRYKEKRKLVSSLCPAFYIAWYKRYYICTCRNPHSIPLPPRRQHICPFRSCRILVRQTLPTPPRSRFHFRTVRNKKSPRPLSWSKQKKGYLSATIKDCRLWFKHFTALKTSFSQNESLRHLFSFVLTFSASIISNWPPSPQSSVPESSSKESRWISAPTAEHAFRLQSTLH